MRISDWSSDVCSSDLSAITVRDGVITELRLAKDSLYANLTSLCRGARTAAIWEVSRCTRSIGALRRNTGSYKTMTAPDLLGRSFDATGTTVANTRKYF